jgi:radical SAM/Cys-rich protein
MANVASDTFGKNSNGESVTSEAHGASDTFGNQNVGIDQGKSIHEQIREYYGRTLGGSDDLKTNATCCTTDAPPKYVRDVLPLVADEIVARFYGCGSPIPPALEGATVVDLGCGTGRDAYVLSKLVGPRGRVIGVDMTPAQLDVARKYQQEQAARFGHAESNVDFRCGYIEDLAALGIESGTVDLVVSNCVINLSPFKRQVFDEIFRVLKPGGELYFSDVFCDRRIPDALRLDPVVRGECLGGALYIDDFRRMMHACGWEHFVFTAVDDIHVSDLELETKLGFMAFTSRTVRAIKAAGLEDAEEDFGQVARYLGTMPELPRYFDFDANVRFIRGRAVAVSGNMAQMLAQSRYGQHFEISAPGAHRGAFDFERAQEALAVRERMRAGSAGAKCNKKVAVDLAFVNNSLERIGAPTFNNRVNSAAALECPGTPETMQVNITYACNLACAHCYLECGPRNTQAMKRHVMQACLDAFVAGGFKVMDITGGSPEMHPHFSWFLAESARVARAAGGHVIVRSNLTLLGQPEHAHLIDELARAGAHVTASLPYFNPESCDNQRGAGVFNRAVETIKRLNAAGFGINPNLPLDLAYNVSGPFLAPPQDLLEDAYRTELMQRAGVQFTNLYAFNNYPLGRFGAALLQANMFDAYLRLLVDNFNALAVTRMMCKSQVNVDFDGRLYDCEVNHVLGLPIQLPATPTPQGAQNAEGVTGGECVAGEARVTSDTFGTFTNAEGVTGNKKAAQPAPTATKDATVFDLLSGPIDKRCIRTHPVCYTCSAGFGSSCSGSLI